MFGSVLHWIREHPIRTAVYALLIAGGILGVLTIRGILRGSRNELLTRVARWSAVRGFVERRFHVRYWVDEIGIQPECGMRFLAKGVKFELVNAGAGSLDAANVCLQGTGDLTGLRIGPDLVAIETVRLRSHGSVDAGNFLWRDRDGEIVRATGIAASLQERSGSLRELRIAGIASVRSITAKLDSAPSSQLAVKTVDVQGVDDLVISQADLLKAGIRLQTAAAALTKMGADVSPFLPEASATAQRLLRDAIWITALLLLALKAPLTRAPKPLVWRIVVIVAPFAALPLLALTHSWIVIAISATAIPIALWALAYRHARQWHERWEPAVVDAAAVALGVPLLLLWSWPAIAIPRLPTIDRILIAQANVDGVNATVRQPECGTGDLARVSVDHAGATKVDIGVARSTLESVDIQRLFAAGNAQTRAVEALRPIRFIPAEWKRAPSVDFCVTAVVRNSGGGVLPEPVCTSGKLIGMVAVDYSKLSGEFAMDWRGRPQDLQLRGAADATGARIDRVTTSAGSPLRIARGSGRVQWSKAIAATFTFHGVETAGATADGITGVANLPMACSTGPVRVDGRAGNIRYLSDGSEIRIVDAGFEFARPERSKVAASASLDGLSIRGALTATIPRTALRFEGASSGQTIPQRLDGRIWFSSGALEIAAPIAFTSDLWNGSINVPNQSTALIQAITARLPPSMALEFGGAGTLGSIAAPVQANADFHVLVPQLITALGPAELELNGLRASAAWDSARGLGPLRLSTGWNTARIGELPGGFSLDEVSKLHIATTGMLKEALAFKTPNITFPTVPRDLRFRFEGTPQAITIFPANGDPILVDGIETADVKAALSGMKFESLDAMASAHVKRAGKVFPISVRSHLTDVLASAELLEPLGARITTTNEAVSFALLRPLDSGKLLDQVGLNLGEIQTKATLSSLEGKTAFAGTKITGLTVAGTIAAGPLLVGKTFDISQTAATTFGFTAPTLPKATAIVSAPALRVSLNGGKQEASLSIDMNAAMATAPAPPSPVLDRLIEAGGALLAHVDNGTRVFGEALGTNFPIRWDLDVNGDGGVLAIMPDEVSFHATTTLRRLDVRQETIDGVFNVDANATLANQHLMLDLRAPGNIGLLGRRFQLTRPVLLSLRKELLRGSGDQLFDLSYHAKHADNTFRVAIGYGDALQFATSLRTPLLLSTADAMAQAQVHWKPSEASIDSYATLSFRGLEAGRAAFPNSPLEDRLNGDVEFVTHGFVADRLLFGQVLSDASRVAALDRLTLSVKLASAGDNGGLPGITQSSTGLSFRPADALLRLLTRSLDLRFPPTAMFYKTLALDFRVQQGMIDTKPVLLTLRGVSVPGVNGLFDSDLRVHWGRSGDPPPRFRDLVYTVQRVMQP